MSLALVYPAPAKVNLFLNLLGCRPDGYHDVRMLMQTIALSDELSITVGPPGLDMTFTCSEETLTQPNNLVVKAYTLFYQTFPHLKPWCLRVHLNKRIPVQAGLGGGSSDAATILKALNELHDHAVSQTELSRLAAQLGSDVPFFLIGGTCLATGRGEQLTPLPNLPSLEMIVLKPKHIDVSTQVAYQWYREENRYAEKTLPLENAPMTFDKLVTRLHNDFETVVFRRIPALHHAKETLLSLGLPGVLLSGTGSALFGFLTRPTQQLLEIQQAFSEDWWYTSTRFRGPLSNPSS